MSSVAVTIQEHFETGQSPRKICDLLKGRVSRCVVYKVLKRLKKAGSALSKVRITPSRKVRMQIFHFIPYAVFIAWFKIVTILVCRRVHTCTYIARCC